MSKKNNKARHRQYVEKLKKVETDQERARVQRQLQRAANRAASTMLDDIENIKIKDEEDNEDEKMDIEVVQQSRRKRRKVFRHKKSKRFG